MRVFARKSLGLFLSYLLVIAVFMLGCQSNQGGTAAPSQTDGAKPDAASATTAKTVSELKIGLPTDAGPLNIYTGNIDYLTELVFDKLFSPSPYVDKPQPWLAESAQQLDDLTWVVKIRSGIKWHDGTPFTAEDVKFTYEYYRDGPANRHTHHVSEVPHIEKIELDDPSTVRFTCAYACPTLDKITFADLPILPKHIWEKVQNPRKYTELPIGTGPYKLVEYKADQYYKFEANKDYFMGSPLVDTLVMPVIKDPTAIFNALRSGEIDISARPIPAELQASFSNLPNMRVVETAPLSLIELKLNYDKAPFNQEAFRNAMSLAVDRQAISDTVLLGQGRPGLKGYPHPDSPWTNPNLSTPYDVEKAKTVLDGLQFVDKNQDGVRETADGKELSFSLKVPSTEPQWIRAAEMLKEQYAKVGIKVKVEVLDSGTMATVSQTRDFDLVISNIGAHGVADPDQFVMSHRSSYLWNKDIPYPAMDELTKKWMAETSVDKRKEIAFQMQELFNKQPTSIVLYYPEEKFAFRSEKFDQWVESPGFGIINKYSLLPDEVKKAVAKQ
ncbi:ABC transporter substrate-binding protein [Brevibacillus reuszeri]|uniref:ABC transporter substrate-binding protein n=1 Tax=Brevibacillus reuszeri TaxID=54915 RepID=UPI00289E1924|nr:ABC transporter substrate-binding protein [Brevibacillus reuszeri]